MGFLRMRKIYPGINSCLAKDCKHNCRFILNGNPKNDGKDCLLDEVLIHIGGKCNGYQPCEVSPNENKNWQ